MSCRTRTYIVTRQPGEGTNSWPCVLSNCLSVRFKETTHSAFRGICQKKVKCPKQVFRFESIWEIRIIHYTQKEVGTARRAIFKVGAIKLQHGGQSCTGMAQNFSPDLKKLLRYLHVRRSRSSHLSRHSLQ